MLRGISLPGQRKRDRGTPTIPEKAGGSVGDPLSNETRTSYLVRVVFGEGQVFGMVWQGNEIEQNLFASTPLHAPRAG